MDDRICVACGEAKPLDAFRRSQTKAGETRYRRKCKLCESRLEKRRIKGTAEHERLKARNRESARRVYAESPERREYMREYARQNRTKLNAYFREYAKQNPDVAGFKRANRHARRGAPFTEDARAYLRILDRDPCAYCGGPSDTTDHIVAIGQGGDGEWTNLTAACRSCNSRKHTQSLLYFMAVRDA